MLAWHHAVARNRGYLAVGALAACQVLSSIYHGMFLLLWLGVLTAVRLHATPRRAVQAGALIMAVPLLVMALYAVPYMRSRADVGERGPSEVAGYSAVTDRFPECPAEQSYLRRDGMARGQRTPPLPRHRRTRLSWSSVSGLRSIARDFCTRSALSSRWISRWDSMAACTTCCMPGSCRSAGCGCLRAPTSSVPVGNGRDRRVWLDADHAATIHRPRLAAAVSLAVVIAASVECLAAPRLIRVPTNISVLVRALRDRPGTVIFEWPVTVPWRLYNMLDVEYHVPLDTTLAAALEWLQWQLPEFLYRAAL